MALNLPPGAFAMDCFHPSHPRSSGIGLNSEVERSVYANNHSYAAFDTGNVQGVAGCPPGNEKGIHALKSRLPGDRMEMLGGW